MNGVRMHSFISRDGKPVDCGTSYIENSHLERLEVISPPYLRRGLPPCNSPHFNSSSTDR